MDKIKSTKEGGVFMKKFFGGLFIETEILEKQGIYHPIKIEYYKTINPNSYKEGKLKYGIEVIKTEYYANSVKVERNEMNSITDDENFISKILKILKKNKVTPTGMQDVVQEIFIKNLQIAKN